MAVAPSLEILKKIPSCEWKIIEAVACILHGSAIITTSFRLAYRWYTARFWWEDAWAVIALAFDIACLFGAWGEGPAFYDDPSVFQVMLWLVPIALTCVVWAARMSIIYSILRVADPRNMLRRIVYGIVACFAVMWVALVVQKVLVCEYSGCIVGSQVAIADLITDTISDLMLVIMPIYLLRDVRLTHHQRILVISAFSASLLVTAMAIPLSVLLFVAPTSDATLIFAHVKSATSLIVANLLVIVTFMYRYFRGSGADLDQPPGGFGAEFTTVIDFNQLTFASTRTHSMFQVAFETS
ncbi:hypothetical protein K503DRAFT_417163 [Rhizopogon vinicolor AM-OR11-026]|uniref:Rhodopsin domain-containing protein n=1 Tax=Rhizopogon vinicolor AM-OR11-026 TaxID=1314800 RepID=A0A1B7MQC0_9AGAM|nr:hypothetical protein K503DRAFT_417163 [Rhizopogon vinicolor AM-OR11-026]